MGLNSLVILYGYIEKKFTLYTRCVIIERWPTITATYNFMPFPLGYEHCYQGGIQGEQGGGGSSSPPFIK